MANLFRFETWGNEKYKTKQKKEKECLLFSRATEKEGKQINNTVAIENYATRDRHSVGVLAVLSRRLFLPFTSSSILRVLLHQQQRGGIEKTGLESFYLFFWPAQRASTFRSPYNNCVALPTTLSMFPLHLTGRPTKNFSITYIGLP